jgi:isopentenyldiphosphate isomerase
MKIPLINEKGDTIGSEERYIVHRDGLLHPEVFVLIRLPNGKFVFQKRSLTKETHPGKLTFSVSGHIELDQTIEQAAINELKEETGIEEKIENLIYLGKVLFKNVDPNTKTINNALRYFFGYNFKNSISDLKIEPEDGAGFEEYSIENIKNLSEQDKNKFVTSLFFPPVLEMFQKF